MSDKPAEMSFRKESKDHERMTFGFIGSDNEEEKVHKPAEESKEALKQKDDV